MITVTVHYGNHNKYCIDLPSNTKLGYLSWYLTKIIGYEPEDVLFIVLCGQLVGSSSMHFTDTLDDCDIVNKRCVASLILKDPDINYPDTELYINLRNSIWLARNKQEQTQIQNQGINSFLQALGMAIPDFTDVNVTIAESEYEQYITQLDEPPEDPCSICSNDIEVDGVALACGHYFHDACIRELLTTSSVKCPYCNYDVREGH